MVSAADKTLVYDRYTYNSNGIYIQYDIFTSEQLLRFLSSIYHRFEKSPHELSE